MSPVVIFVMFAETEAGGEGTTATQSSSAEGTVASGE